MTSELKYIKPLVISTVKVTDTLFSDYNDWPILYSLLIISYRSESAETQKSGAEQTEQNG